MNKKGLKNLIMPIVKECIHEALLSEGILSGIISEVMRGTQAASTIVEPKPQRTRKNSKRVNEVFRERVREQSTTPRVNRAEEARKKLSESIGLESYNGINLFEGTEPLNSGGNTGNEIQPQGPLSGVEPGDSGVDIAGIMNIAGNRWQKFK